MNKAIKKNTKIYLAGHSGLVGSSVLKLLKSKSYDNLLLKNRNELDLLSQFAVNNFFLNEKPEVVIICAARVGGIQANKTYPADFIYENLQIQNNIIWSALRHGVKKLLFLGSSCIYPRECPQPMKEEYFMSGPVEPTNEAYAISKIAGIKLCEKIFEQHSKTFISCMPTNIYGENDNFKNDSSHVIPALIRRIHDARVHNKPKVTIWGSGNSRREFLHVNDLAKAIIWLLENYDDKQFLNVGTGKDISIKELAYQIAKIINYGGKLEFDDSKPDGMPRKLLDVSKIESLGWKHSISLTKGLKSTYRWYLNNVYKESGV